MKIEKLIEKLQDFKNKYGDVEVYILSNGCKVEWIETGDCGKDEEMHITID